MQVLMGILNAFQVIYSAMKQEGSCVFRCMVSKMSNVHLIPLHQYCITLSPDPPVINTVVSLGPPVANVVRVGVGRGNRVVNAGQPVLVYCPATGIPTPMPTLARRVGGSLVPVDPSRVTTTDLSGIPALLYSIFSFASSDVGEYVCTAETIAGSDTESVRLDLSGEECSVKLYSRCNAFHFSSSCSAGN